MSYNYQDAPRESQQEYFGKVHTDNKETLKNALKRIEELEQKLEQTEKDLAISEHDREHNDYELTEVYKKVEQFEKENAELKEKYDTYLRENTGLKIHNAYIEKKLTEAKELLNMFLRLHYNPIVDEHTLFCKVEQFLNSEVEK